MMTVEQMINRNGNGAMNQFVLSDDTTLIFQSYKSTIVVVDYTTKTITFGSAWDYSNTTNKHRNIFFDDYFKCEALADTQSVRKAIAKGYVERNNTIWTVTYDESL